MIGEEFLWTEKYRPQTVDECILPDRIKDKFNEFVKQGSVPNLLLAGDPGIGKTTIAKAVCNDLGCDSMIINGSMNGNIDTLRTEIASFASSVSFMGGRKVCILDEADYLTHATQPALRNFMEEFSKNCGFILTCNFKNKIIEPLHSRLTEVDFRLTKDDKLRMGSSFLKRVIKILELEGVPYDKKVVVKLIQEYLPDWRKVLNELQSAAANGQIDDTILVSLTSDVFNELINLMREKNFTGVRKWVTENSDIDSSVLYRKIYDTASTVATPGSIPGLVVTLAKYQYQEAFVAARDINTAACFAEIMVDTIWAG